MSNDVTDEAAPVSNLPRLRFSLLAALLFITLVCIALGYAFRTRYCHATALFRVSSQLSTLWDGDAQKFDAREYEILKNTQTSLIKSYFVLQAALRNPGIASLSIFAGKDDPVAWLSENIEADFLDDSEVLAIRLCGNRVYDTDIQQVVDAVAKAYEQEVVSEEKSRQLKLRDNLARKLSGVEDELKDKMKILFEIKAAAGSTDSIDVDFRRQDVDTLSEIARDMARRLEIMDVNAEMPDEMRRIRKLQPAVITND